MFEQRIHDDTSGKWSSASGSKTFPITEDVTSDEFNTQAIENAKMNAVSSPRQDFPLNKCHGKTLIAIISAAVLILVLVVILAVKIPGHHQHNMRGPLLVSKPSAPPSFGLKSVAPVQSPALIQATAVPTITSNTQSPAAVAKEKALRLETFLSILRDRNVSSQEALQNATSPQSLALHWLAEEDDYMANLPTSMSAEELANIVQNRYIMATIYHANTGSVWYRPSNFMMTNESICSWHDYANDTGVFCDPFKLILNVNELYGTIISEVGNLLGLQALDLSGNNLVGTIPSSLGELTELTYLRLDENILNSTIPTELGRFTRLQFLDFHTNWFLRGTLPTELGLLTELAVFNVNNNTLTGTYPTELGQLTNLHDFALAFNDFDGTVPSEFGMLKHLIYLDLQFNNKLNGTFPTEIASFANLTELYLGGNAWSGNFTPAFCGSTSKAASWDNFETDCLDHPGTCNCCTKCF